MNCWYPKTFWKKEVVLENIDLTLNQGEIIGLVGDNGAGKTTLIKSIIGLHPYHDGDFFIQGKSLKKFNSKWLNSVGYLPELPELPDRMRGETYLRIFGRFYGFNSKDLNHRISEVLAFTELEDAGGKRIKTYSKGMKKRLMIALSIFNKPELLLLDEPLEGIDPTRRENIKKGLKAMSKNNVSVIVSSHEILELDQLCDRIVRIESGTLASK